MSPSALYKVFAVLSFISACIWRNTLIATFKLALKNDGYTHILLIIPVSAILVAMEWRRGELKPQPSLYMGSAVLSVGVLIGLGGLMCPRTDLATNDVRLAIEMLALVVWWLGSFVLCFGTRTFRSCAFPLLFLMWMVPLPGFALDRVIELLQQGTTWCARELFTLVGIPVTQDATVLAIPGFRVEVAKECSSIRSSIMLIVSSMILAYLLLRSSWSRAVVILVAIPLAIAKNGVRVFTLATLGAYVDPGILNSWLHHQGGVVFFAGALAVIFGLILIAARIERRQAKGSIDTRFTSLSMSGIE